MNITLKKHLAIFTIAIFGVSCTAYNEPSDAELLAQSRDICKFASIHHVKVCPSVNLLTSIGATYSFNTTTGDVVQLADGVQDFTEQCGEWSKVPIKSGELSNNCVFSDSAVPKTLVEVEAYADACVAAFAIGERCPATN